MDPISACDVNQLTTEVPNLTGNNVNVSTEDVTLPEGTTLKLEGGNVNLSSDAVTLTTETVNVVVNTPPMPPAEFTSNILISVKKLLGIEAGYTHFDPDLILHINSVFSVLTQLGVGSSDGFSITGGDETWEDFLGEHSALYSLVKSYMYLKVRLLFDPPLSSAAVDSINRQISEFEWRIFVTADTVKDAG